MFPGPQGVIEVDPQARIAQVQGCCTYGEDLVDATRHGLMPHAAAAEDNHPRRRGGHRPRGSSPPLSQWHASESGPRSDILTGGSSRPQKCHQRARRPDRAFLTPMAPRRQRDGWPSSWRRSRHTCTCGTSARTRSNFLVATPRTAWCSGIPGIRRGGVPIRRRRGLHPHRVVRQFWAFTATAPSIFRPHRAAHLLSQHPGTHRTI